MADVSHRALYGDNPPNGVVEITGERGPAGAGYGILITEFGADVTGVSDSTAAIQRAVDYAYNSHEGVHPTILVPHGKYKISSSILMRPHVRLVGTGEGTSHSSAGTHLGWGAEFVAAAGFNGYAFLYNQNSVIPGPSNGLPETDTYGYSDCEISRISYRGAWSGRADVTVTTGGMIKFDGCRPIQGCRFENLLCANVAQHVIDCTVIPLPGLFSNIWGRKVGGSVLNVVCGPVYGSSTALGTHFFRASNIQGDFIVGPLIKIDATPVIDAGNGMAQCVFMFDGIKHEIDSDAADTVTPTTAFSKYTIHLVNLDRSAVSVIGANVLTSNPLGGGTPVTTDGALLYMTGTSGKGPYWEVIASRYGSAEASTDYLVWDAQHGTAAPYTVHKRYRSASWMPDMQVKVGRVSNAVVEEVRVSSDSIFTFDDYPRRQTLADGEMQWGGGAAVADVRLYRPVPNKLTMDDIFQARKLFARGQTAPVEGDFVLSSGWGSTASVVVDSTSSDQAGKITVTCGGAGIAANPTVTFTFTDTAVSPDGGSNPVGWGRAPIPMAHVGRLSTGANLPVTCSSNFSTLTMELEGTPVDTLTYIIYYSLMG